MSNIRHHLTRLGLLIAIVIVLCLGLVACTDYSNPGNGTPSSTPSSGGY
ncbi:MAG TPA: hypothetical protein VGP82_19025 [Ktedonobacterales bacterium]|jgi:hypothetical protein|nr:hypothetical protein [Ktedonobacterales bacterium]